MKKTHLPNPPSHTLPRPMSQQPQLLRRRDNRLPALGNFIRQLGEICRGTGVKARHGEVMLLHVGLELLRLPGDLLGQGDHL